MTVYRLDVMGRLRLLKIYMNSFDGSTATGTARTSTPNCSSCEGVPKASYKGPFRTITPGIPERKEDEKSKWMDILATIQANGQSTKSIVCTCGKVCKNQTGLKIHQTNMVRLQDG